MLVQWSIIHSPSILRELRSLFQEMNYNNNFRFSNPLQAAMWWVLHLAMLLMILKREKPNVSTSNYCISVLLRNSFNSIIFTVFPQELRLHRTKVFSFRHSQSEHVDPALHCAAHHSTSPSYDLEAKTSGGTNYKKRRAFIRDF